MEENKDLMMEMETMVFESFEELPIAVEVVDQTSRLNPKTVAGIVAVVGIGAYIGYKKLKNKKEDGESKGLTNMLVSACKARFGKAEEGMDTEGDFDYDELEFDEE